MVLAALRALSHRVIGRNAAKEASDPS